MAEVFDVARKSIFWMIAAALIALMVMGLVFLIADFRGSITDVPGATKANLIALRFTTIPDCFAYQDEKTGRVYVGTVDEAKWNTEQLNRCYSTGYQNGKNDINFRLQLKDSPLPELLTAHYFHLDDYTIEKSVLVRNGDEIRKGTLLISVQEDVQ